MGFARRRRWLLLTTGCVVLLSVAVVLRVAASSPVHIDRDTFEKVEVGMTEAEVNHLLGGPPGDYTGNARLVGLSASMPPCDRRESWIGDGYAICVGYDRNGTVIWKSEDAVFYVDDRWRWLRRACRRLGL